MVRPHTPAPLLRKSVRAGYLYRGATPRAQRLIAEGDPGGTAFDYDAAAVAGGAWLSTLTAVATAISWGFANSLVVNFGALSAFLVLHVSVVVHYVARQHSRDWWRHLVVPVIGFLILAYVVVNAQGAAQTLGFVWLVVGVVVLAVLLVRGRRPALAVGDNP